MTHFDQVPQKVNDEERNIPERQEDDQNTYEYFLEEHFGEKEVPQELQKKFENMQEALYSNAKENRFLDENDPKYNENLAKFEEFAVETILYKEGARDLEIVAVPEKGISVKYTDKNGEKKIKALNKDEQDFFFNMEMYADGLKEHVNAQNFSRYVNGLIEKHTKDGESSPSEKDAQDLIDEVYGEYYQFGFSREDIKDLILIADKEGTPFLEKTGVVPTEKRFQAFKECVANVFLGEERAEIFSKYLTDQQRSKFYKLGIYLMGVGAVEGLTPLFLSKAIGGSNNLEEAALNGLYALGVAGGGGLAKKHLNVMLDRFINEAMQSGLTKKLSREISYLPGEKIGGDPSEVLQATRKSQEGLSRLLKDYALTNIPAIGKIITAGSQLVLKSPLLAVGTIASAPFGAMLYKWARAKKEPLIDETYEQEKQQDKEILSQLGAHFETSSTGQKEQMAKRLEILTKKGMEISHERERLRTETELYRHLISTGNMVAIAILSKAVENIGIHVSEDAINAVVTAQMLSGELDTVMRSNMEALEHMKAMMEMEQIFDNYSYKEIVGDESRLPVETLPNMGIDFKDIGIKLEGRGEVLKNINLKIHPGDFMRLHGDNGAGKTTLLKILSGYYEPTSGEVNIGGVNAKDIKKGGNHGLGSRIAFLPQKPYLYKDSLAENITVGCPGASDEEIRDVIKEVGLDGLLKENNKESNIDIHDKKIDFSKFSGGEEKRIVMARMLLRMRRQDIGIVIMDEPTNDISEKAKDILLDIIKKEKEKKPDMIFITVSHDKDFAKQMKKVIGNMRIIDVDSGNIKETTGRKK